MGSSYEYSAPSSTSPQGSLQQYLQYLPATQGNLDSGIVNTAGAETKATANTVPTLNALDLQQLDQYALPDAQVGQQITNSDALAGAQTNLSQLEGVGGEAATAAQKLSQNLNPSYYNTINSAANGAQGAINAIDLGGLSPGEAAATERSLNQTNTGTGNLGVLNPQNTISNALNFGGAFNNKIGLMNNATNAASNVAGVAAGNAGLNPTAVALGQPATSAQSNFGTSAFNTGNTGSSSGAAGTTGNIDSSLLSGVTSLNNAAQGANAQLGSTSMNTNSTSTYLGDICCFIFLEAYHGKIPWHVRHYRDKMYNVNHDIATGYRRTARFIVPLMQKYDLIRKAVWVTMIKPITDNCTSSNKNKLNRLITHSWLRLWATLGKGHAESEYSMKWTYVK